MKKVMVFGTFDNLHKGHRFFLKKASSHGNYLIAVVARDSTVDELKGINPIHDFHNRKRHLIETGLVNKTVPSDKKRGSWTVIQQEKPQVICLGHDQMRMKESLCLWLKTQKNYAPEVIILPPFKRNIYSTSAHRRRKEKLFMGLLLLSMALMALSWVSGSILSHNVPFRLTVFWRFFFSCLPFFPFGSSILALKLSRKEFFLILLSSAVLICYNLLFFWGLSVGSAGKGSIIVTTLNPLYTSFIYVLFNKKRPTHALITGLVLGFLGGIILIEPWKQNPSMLLSPGNILFPLAALCWAILTLLSGKIQQKISLKKYNFYLYFFASIGSLLLALPASPFNFSQYTSLFWMNILYLGLAVSALATSLYFLGTKKLGPSRASSFLLTIPLFALFFSWIFLDEIPAISTYAGGVLSMIALYLINKKES